MGKYGYPRTSQWKAAMLMNWWYTGSGGPVIPPGETLITTDSTAYTIDTTTLYTIDNNNISI